MAAPTARRGALTEQQISLFQHELRVEGGLESLSSLMSAAGNETRIRILYLLWRHGEIRVNDLAEILNVSTPAVSQQLKKLRRHRLVRARRDAQAVFYSLSSDQTFVRRLTDLFERFARGGRPAISGH
jgi:ArsR family transcriptional regulator, lead/cadmium/zinc/bismuth-responsive transcriptional repressor